MSTQRLHEDQDVTVFYPRGPIKNGVYCGKKRYGCVVVFDDESADAAVQESWIKDRQASLFSVSSVGCDN